MRLVMMMFIALLNLTAYNLLFPFLNAVSEHVLMELNVCACVSIVMPMRAIYFANIIQLCACISGTKSKMSRELCKY